VVVKCGEGPRKTAATDCWKRVIIVQMRREPGNTAATDGWKWVIIAVLEGPGMLRRFTWRQVTVAGTLVLAVVSVVAYMRQNRSKHQVSPSQAQPGAKPGVQGTSGATRFPESAPFDVLRPRYPVDEAVRHPFSPRPAADQRGRTAGTGAPMFPPDASDEGVNRLSVPPTEVHIISGGSDHNGS
jgi:hypothetical protein